MGKPLTAKRVTIQDLAREIGVSHTAVSKALQGAADVSPELTRRVRLAARKYHYYPRAAAQLLRNGRTNQIGLIVATDRPEAIFQGGFLGPLVGHLIAGCGERQLRYMIEAHHYAEPHKPTHLIHSGLVDAALLIGDVGDEERTWLEQNEAACPYVSINEPARHCVLADADTGVYEAIRKIAQLGHKKLAFAGGPVRHLMHRAGLAAFQRAVRDFHLTVDEGREWICHFDSGRNEELAAAAFAWATRILTQPERPTVIFSLHGDAVARALIYAAQQNGLCVPQDLSVACWCSEDSAAEFLPRLDAVSLDYRQMAGAALDMLELLINGGQVAKPHQEIVPRWIEGKTLRVPNTTK